MTKEELARTFEGPKSVCQCEHLGDVPLATPIAPSNQHGGAIGHGACFVPGCTCPKFTWKRWSAGFEEELKKLP